MARNPRTSPNHTIRPRWLTALLIAALAALTLAVPATAAPDGWPCYSQYNQACVSQFGYTGQSTWGYPVDAWGNNCTNYAAFRLAANGATNPGNLGNADVWDDNARGKGIPVDQTPAVGSIAQWETMHVAYVDWVSADGNQIAISETSYDIWLNGVHYVSSSGRRVLNRGGTGWPSDLEFIHVKDVATDRDGDGLVDSADVCPNRFAPLAQGCQMAFPPSVEGIDYNGDGRQDRLAFYRYDAYQLALFGWAGSGSGMNAPVPLWQTPAGWEGNRVIPIGVTDYTGDGRSDVLAFYRYDNYELALFGWAGNGAGLSAPAQVWHTPAGWDGGRIIPAGITEFNGDGRADVLAYYRYDNYAVTLFGWASTGSGFAPPVPLWQTAAGWEGARLIPAGVADFNGDGREDILAYYRYDNNELALFGWAGTSAGVSFPVQVWHTPSGWDGNRVIPAGVGDFNSDGRADVLAYYRYDGYVLTLFGWAGNGSGLGGPTQLWQTPAGWEGSRVIPAGIADYNADGRGDVLAYYRYDNNELALFGWPGAAAGVSSPVQLWHTPSGWDGNRLITVPAGSGDRRATPAAPSRVDGCGVGKDTYTVPVSTGVEYVVGGAVKAAGTYPTGGAASVTVTARAKAGYVLTGTTTWTLTWTTTACTTTVTGNALSTPTWTLPKATLTWATTGAPAGTTVTYDVQYRAVTLSTTGARLYPTPTTWYTHTTTKTGTISGTAGGVYQIHARTTDQYGTIGAWSPWTTVTMPIDDRATSFGYTGTWTTGTSTSYYAGTYKLTSTPGAKVTVTAWTDQVALIGARTTTSGKATITIDGVLKATIDTYAATAAYRQTLATITIPYGKHTITITNQATTGRPRLILDALAFRR